MKKEAHGVKQPLHTVLTLSIGTPDLPTILVKFEQVRLHSLISLHYLQEHPLSSGVSKVC